MGCVFEICKDQYLATSIYWRCCHFKRDPPKTRAKSSKNPVTFEKPLVGKHPLRFSRKQHGNSKVPYKEVVCLPMSSKLHMFSYMKSNFQGYSRAHERVSWMLHPNGGTSAMGHDVLFPGSFRWVKSDLYMLRMRIFHLCASPRRYHNAKFTQFRCVPTTAPPQSY